MRSAEKEKSPTKRGKIPMDSEASSDNDNDNDNDNENDNENENENENDYKSKKFCQICKAVGGTCRK